MERGSGFNVAVNGARFPPVSSAVVVLTTVATEEEGSALVHALLERRLIACGTLLPAGRSFYRWQGAVVDEREIVILLKTRPECVIALENAFTELHPYKVPELLALPVSTGLPKYLAWIGDETNPVLKP